MQKCPKCSHINRVGVLFCEKCGTYLRGGAAPGRTKTLDEAEQSELAPVLTQEAPTKPPAESARGTDLFPKGGNLRLEIEGSPEPLQIAVGHREIVLGRRDPATGALPEVDLTPYAGYRMGVSRRHSQIRPSDDGHLDLFDLGSSNGTFLNGQRLDAHYPYRLHHGDKIGLGQIVIHIFFQQPAVEAEKPAVVEPASVEEVPTEKPGLAVPVPTAGAPAAVLEAPQPAKAEGPTSPAVAQPEMASPSVAQKPETAATPAKPAEVEPVSASGASPSASALETPSAIKSETAEPIKSDLPAASDKPQPTEPTTAELPSATLVDTNNKEASSQPATNPPMDVDKQKGK